MCFQSKVNFILSNLSKFHNYYYTTNTFNGPSLHFHLKALEEKKFFKKVEYIYAALTAWGMHRMGKKGAKMKEWECFLGCIQELKEKIKSLENVTPEQLDNDGWNKLREIFMGIDVMASKTSIVGNSKVMAHLLPKLCAPIDRQYTLHFLFGTTNITNRRELEFEKFKKIHEDFYYKVLSDAKFKKASKEWLNKYPWDTSELKIIDNLVIAVRGVEANGQA